MDPKLSSDDFNEYLLGDQSISKEEEFNCYLCSATYEKDLQLAAELGKTLLERNKELETSLKNYQTVIEDQSQEINHLTKQTSALKDVNASRLKIYEQLEVSIQDLEKSKETLERQNAADKKQIKNLLETVSVLESKCDEFQTKIDHLTNELKKEKRRVLDANDFNKNDDKRIPLNADDIINERNSKELADKCEDLTVQLRDSKVTSAKDQKIIEDLRDQISILLRENNYLQELLDDHQHENEEMKTLQEELATLEQIRYGNLCKRCLRSIISTDDCSSTDDLSLIMANEEEQELAKSIASALFNNEKSSPALEGHPENPYRLLVEKYEALLKMQEQQPHWVRQRLSTTKSKQCMSLRDELQLSGNFYDKKDMTDSEFEDEPYDQGTQPKSIDTSSQKPVTLSPVVGDGVVNKSTQTEVLAASLPGSFLCKISDGNDCQFSIYDDASPVESRFRKTPEYRQLFKEIFAVLKRAAEAKDEGESLPLLDDRLPAQAPTHLDLYQQPRVPPATPAREEQPLLIPDDEILQTPASKTIRPSKNLNLPLQPQEMEVTSTTDDIGQKPHQQRDVMEHLMAGVRPKRNLSRSERRALTAAHVASSSPSPCNSRSSSKRRSGSKMRKKRERLTDSPNRSRERHQQKSNRPVEELELIAKVSEKTESQDSRRARPVSMYAFGSGSSQASMEVAKLKILEKSYAEVLRMGRTKTGAGKSGFV